MKKQFIIASENEMKQLGEQLAESAFAGEFIAFFGGLGAGKTTLIRYMAASLGADDAASPTFTIVRQYDACIPMLHFDCYRLADADELFMIGFDDYLASNALIVMEWSENVTEALPDERLEIHITGSGNEPRRVELTAFSEKYESILEGITL